MTRVRKILVPVDFSYRSAHGLRYAAALAREMNAELTVLYIAEEPERSDFFESLVVCELQSAVAKRNNGISLDRLAQERTLDLYRFIQEAGSVPTGLKIRRQVEIGNPVKETVRVAKEESIDLIVLAIQKKSLFSYLVARDAILKRKWRFPCPVVVTPTPLRQKPGPGERVSARIFESLHRLKMLSALMKSRSPVAVKS
jgi:nucleotide-binding universal stress UspA family protein